MVIWLRRIATVLIGIVLVFEAAATGFNLWRTYIALDWKPPQFWLMSPIPLILLISGALVLRGRFWPILLPIGYVLAISLYVLATGSGEFVIPWPLPERV